MIGGIDSDIGSGVDRQIGSEVGLMGGDSGVRRVGPVGRSIVSSIRGSIVIWVVMSSG